MNSKEPMFGTDGIRAPFGTPPLVSSTVTLLGYRLGELLGAEAPSPSVIIGGDTRISTPEISRWLAAGLAAAGTRAVFGGTLPTPAIAELVRLRNADAGISVSASHNLHPYNGIKIFDRRGFKWSPEAEAGLEVRIPGPDAPDVPPGPELRVDSSLAQDYLGRLRHRVGANRGFEGMKIVLDTANGAATPFAEPLFTSLGAEVVSLGNAPDGININAGCGSTAPAAMAAAVKSHRADLGIAFDGDADRALIADETGQMCDGDAMLYAWAHYLHQQKSLEPKAIVATSMSNLGLEKALERLGISVIRCDVGDRTVVTTMSEQGIRLGGEQSGHLVDLAQGTTGDGLGTALQMVSILRQASQPLSALLSGFRRFPQVLQNVEVARKPDLLSLPAVAATVERVENRLGSEGRLVLRYSGTEPLARVMIEGPDLDEIESLAAQLIDVIRTEIGAPSP